VRAYELQSFDGPAALKAADVDPPVPDDGEVLIDVHAIGVNFPDLLLTRGLYQHRPPLPAVPGCEIAGTVARAPGGSDWRDGDRVSAFVWDGGFAEQAVAPLHAVAAVPDGVDLAAAAAMTVNHHTVHFALHRRGSMRAGETVLVLGAAGGVGVAAVQVAKGSGARVIAAVRREEQTRTTREAGADETILVGDGFASKVRELTDGRGVDVVVDPVGGWLFDEARRCLAPEGRLLVIGFAAGDIPEVKVNKLLLRNVSVVGVAFGAFLERDPELMGHQAASLARMGAAGHVTPMIGRRFSFDELPLALQALADGEIPGKGVIHVGDDLVAADAS
jgi:NADPH:quinone reductase